MKQLANTINSLLGKFGYHISKKETGMWDLDNEFTKEYELIKDMTVVKKGRSHMLFQFAKYAKNLSGDVAQLGVYKGGTAKMIARQFDGTGKTMYLFDTFEGLPPSTKEDGKYGNDNVGFSFDDVSFEGIQEYFKELSCIELKKGFFPDTAKGLEDKKFCFVYLDADLYESTRDGLEFFYPRMVPGGVILLDDYKTATWPGIEKAVKEFCEKNGTEAMNSTWWQGLIIKGGE